MYHLVAFTSQANQTCASGPCKVTAITSNPLGFKSATEIASGYLVVTSMLQLVMLSPRGVIQTILIIKVPTFNYHHGRPTIRGQS